MTNLALGLRSAIANDGSVVARVGMNANQTDPIIYYNPAGMPTTIAATGGAGWLALGRSPGISADGSIVVWIGERETFPGSGIGMGLGVFAARVSSPSNVTLIAGENAIMTNPDLGYDAAGMDIFLTFTAAQRDSRVGIALQETAGPGITAGNSFVVTFLGTPSAASIDNPKLPPGTPLFFSNQAGIWSVRVDLENELDPPGPLVFNYNSPTPVVQINETIHTPSGSFAINAITELYDPIANVALDSAGMPRTQRRGDHQIAFRATSGASTIVVRAVQRDSDEDGLYDHWERPGPGGGIDVDRDGIIDLSLNALGANPLLRDIFIEIDWTHPRVDPPRSYSNEPAPGALKLVADAFNGAPALPNGIPAVINAHIDAGPPGRTPSASAASGNDLLGDKFSQNFMTGHQGGDLVGQVGMPTAHLDLVYFGTPGSFSIPGAQARSLQDIKQNFFGSADKFAREFAFHYLVLADSHEAYEDFATDVNADGLITPGDQVGGDGVLTRAETTYIDSGKTPRSATPAQFTVTAATAASVSVSAPSFSNLGSGLFGQGVLITSGTGAGQLRLVLITSPMQLTVSPLWTIEPDPGDTFVILGGAAGLAEGDFWPKPNNHGVPGNDFVVTFGSWQRNPGGFLASKLHWWRTIVHELGHNLGLRHCGPAIEASACPSPGSYLSLMSYAHVHRPSSTVNSYSSAGDPSGFEDWFNLRPDFNRAQVSLGRSHTLTRFPQAALLPGALLSAPDREPDYADAVQSNGGPIDFEPPTLDITSPMSGASFLQGQNLPVLVTATDNVALASGSVNVRFDVDGSGAIDQTGEMLIGTPTANPNEFEVTFTSLAGPDGIRKIDARASDTPMGNVGQDLLPIFVPEPGLTQMMLFAVPLVVALGRLRRRS